MPNSCDYSHRPHCKSQIHSYIWKLHVSPHTICLATQFTSKFLQEGWSICKGKSANQRDISPFVMQGTPSLFQGDFLVLWQLLLQTSRERPGKKLLLTAGLPQVGSKCNTPWTLGLASIHKLCQGYTPTVLPVLFVDPYSATSFSRIISSNTCLCSC